MWWNIYDGKGVFHVKHLIHFLRGIIGLLFAVLILIESWACLQREILDRPAPRLWGISYYPVEEEDMLPELNVGDLALIYEQDSYAPGDAVAFYREDGLYLRRIVGEVNGGFIVKGDNLPAEDDQLVMTEDILGAVRNYFSRAGELMDFLWSIPGILVTLLLGFLLFKLPGWLIRPRSELPRRRDLIDPRRDEEYMDEYIEVRPRRREKRVKYAEPEEDPYYEEPRPREREPYYGEPPAREEEPRGRHYVKKH